MNKKKAFFISGLGADRKAFKYIRLPENYEPHHIDWIAPEPREELSHYAQRLATNLPTTKDNIIIGLSFGGLMATELAPLLQPRKVIIISSMATAQDIPWYFQRAGRLQLQKILPVGFFKLATLLNRMVGTASAEEKAIVQSYVKNADPQFIRWSLNAIVNWQQKEKLKDLVHIHGTRDHLLPCRYTHADYRVENGGHLMVFNKAEEVNRLLHEILKELD